VGQGLPKASESESIFIKGHLMLPIPVGQSQHFAECNIPYPYRVCYTASVDSTLSKWDQTLVGRGSNKLRCMHDAMEPEPSFARVASYARRANSQLLQNNSDNGEAYPLSQARCILCCMRGKRDWATADSTLPLHTGNRSGFIDLQQDISLPNRNFPSSSPSFHACSVS
jgi:hypothetical protein